MDSPKLNVSYPPGPMDDIVTVWFNAGDSDGTMRNIAVSVSPTWKTSAVTVKQPEDGWLGGMRVYMETFEQLRGLRDAIDLLLKEVE